MHATLVHRWHLQIIEDLIDDDNQDDEQQPNHYVKMPMMYYGGMHRCSPIFEYPGFIC